MKTKYFEYAKSGNGEKYVEVTLEQFATDIIKSDKRFYISFGDSAMECEEKEYRAYAKERNRHRYLLQNSQKRIVEIISLDDVDENQLLTDSFEDDIAAKIMQESLSQAVKQLSDSERLLLQRRFFENRTEKSIGEEFGENQQVISARINALLVKLAELQTK